MGDQHSLTLALGFISLTVATPSAVVALAAVGMVCGTAIAVAAITSKMKN